MTLLRSLSGSPTNFAGITILSKSPGLTYPVETAASVAYLLEDDKIDTLPECIFQTEWLLLA
jgi:hypothetical protein